MALAVVAWAYGIREERVPGRAGPATLRILAIFLVLGGLALPAFRGRVASAPARVVLVDVSRSMALPAGPGAGAPSRLDSARHEIAALSPDRLYRFGSVPAPLLLDSLGAVEPGDAESRLAPALEAAWLGGADSVWVLTDGEVVDRDEARAMADRLGLGWREIRVAPRVPRVGIVEVAAPDRVRAGDTVRVAIRLRAADQGGADSVPVELRGKDGVLARRRLARPSSGRTETVELSFVPAAGGDDEWRRYEIALGSGADPFGRADRVALWIEVSDAATGAVFVSTEPDWEGRFLVPALDRLVLGGARGFLRLGDGRFLELGANPRVVAEAAVVRSIPGVRLLVVEGAPSELPGWLSEAFAAQPRTLLFARGPGPVPGSGQRVDGPIPGEWYPTPPIPPSPAAALLADVSLDPLPPVREMFSVVPGGEWSVLQASRNRRGEPRPLLVAGERKGGRWAIAVGTEWWRWALRGGASRRVYEGALAGLVGWLVEDASGRLVSLASSPRVGRPLQWRIRPGARDLTIEVRDADGEPVWAESRDDPPTRVTGPALGPGRYEIRVRASAAGEAYRASRPLELAEDPREFLTVASPTPEAVPARPRERAPSGTRSPRPVWPFALAILLLCVEWMWRHRIGLR